MPDVLHCSVVAMYRRFCQNTRRHIPENSSHSCHRLKNLKARIFIILQVKFFVNDLNNATESDSYPRSSTTVSQRSVRFWVAGVELCKNR